MALAWKAGWVHALTSSNLVSSADSPPLGLCEGGLVFVGGLTQVNHGGLSLVPDAQMRPIAAAPSKPKTSWTTFHEAGTTHMP